MPVRPLDRGHTALVLAGGGARGAYQAGVLIRLAERLTEDLPFRIITGVSAGGINATALACHRGTFRQATRDLMAAWLRLTVDKVFRANFGALSGSFARWLWMLGTGGVSPGFELRSLFDTAPLHRYLEQTLDLDGVTANLRAGRLRALALSATSYRTGNTVTFVDGVTGLESWTRARRRSIHTRIGLDHVMASAALPILFPAIPLGDDFYGDGSIRQASPLAPAVHLGAHRLLTISMRYPRAQDEPEEAVRYPTPAQILSMLMHGVFLDALENDAERLERINRTLKALPEGTSHPEGLRPVRLLVLRPSRDVGKLSQDLLDTLPRPLRILTRGLGASRGRSPDFLSYLLFERPYVERLMDLGYHDAGSQWDRIERFFEA